VSRLHNPTRHLRVRNHENGNSKNRRTEEPKNRRIEEPKNPNN
jgi:hypothetical protein